MQVLPTAYCLLPVAYVYMFCLYRSYLYIYIYIYITICKTNDAVFAIRRCLLTVIYCCACLLYCIANAGNWRQSPNILDKAPGQGGAERYKLGGA